MSLQFKWWFILYFYLVWKDSKISVLWMFKHAWQRLPLHFTELSQKLDRYVIAIRLPKTSSRCLCMDSSISFQDVLRTCLEDVFKTFLRRCLPIMSWRPLGRQKNVTLKMSSICLQELFSKSSPRRMFAG